MWLISRKVEIRDQDYLIPKSVLIITILFDIKSLLTGCLNLNKYLTSVNLSFHVCKNRDRENAYFSVWYMKITFLLKSFLLQLGERICILFQRTAQQKQSKVCAFEEMCGRGKTSHWKALVNQGAWGFKVIACREVLGWEIKSISVPLLHKYAWYGLDIFE